MTTASDHQFNYLSLLYGTPLFIVQLSQGGMLVARAALFSLYWSLAALVMEPQQRTAVEAALREGATACDLQRALPKGSIAGHLLGPKAGDWCPWTVALGPIHDDRHNIEIPG